MLEMRNVVKTFNKGTVDEKVALAGLSLTVKEGEFVTVIGGNGAGKSTMQNAICGTWRPDSGSILLDGIDVTRLPEHKRAKYLGRVYQDPMLGTAAAMQIEENLALAFRRGRHRTLMPGIRRAEREEYRRKLTELGLGLENRLTAKAGTLSGGQRQALTLLMATLQKPRLLLLDEHTAALDPKTASVVMSITERIVLEERLTTLMITHNMRDAIRYGDRLIMLHAGNIILDISGEEKKNLTVTDLLEKFSVSSHRAIVSVSCLPAFEVSRVQDQLHTFLLPEQSAVQREVIVVAYAPIAVSVEAVVIAASVIHFLEPLFNRLFGRAVPFQHVFGAVCVVCVNENVQAVGASAQDVVRTAPHNDAGFLFCQLLNDVCLRLVEFLVNGRVAVGASRTHGDLIQEAVCVRSVFLVVADEFFRQPALLCHLADKLTVIEGNAHPLGNCFSNGMSTASEFTADGDDPFCHTVFLLTYSVAAILCRLWGTAYSSCDECFETP